MSRRIYGLLVITALAASFLRLWRLTAVPPGLHYDLAATALLGNEVAFNGYRPLFISAFTGHEPLFYYWLALWFRLIGSSVFALRLAAAMAGVLTIPAAFFAVRQVMRFRPLSRPLAVLATVGLAGAFFHIVFSRFGFRVITQPLVQSLALGFLFRGLQCWHHRGEQGKQTAGLPAGRKFFGLGRYRRCVADLALGGFFTGLAAYTYLAARLFPLPLAVFLIAWLTGAWREGRERGRKAAVAAGWYLLAATITFAPLAVYFIHNPQDFLNRAGQVAPRAGEVELVWQGMRRAAEMIFITGEPYDRFNLPGRPLFGPVWGFFFVVGLAVTIWNLGRRGKSASRPGDSRAFGYAVELMLLSWLPAMLLPTALAVHEISPSNVRAFGLIPLVFVFPARGVLACLGLAERWWAGAARRLWPAVSAALLLAGTVIAGRDYFFRWANLPNQWLNNDADLTAIADYLNAQDLTAAEVYVSAIHYRHPTLAYLAHAFADLHWFTGGMALAVPADRQALYVFARSAPPPAEWTTGWDDHLTAAPPAPDGMAAFRAYRFAAGETPPLPDFESISENFGNIIFLTGYRLVPQPDRVIVDLRWRVENLPASGDLLPYVRLQDAWGNGWSQSSGFSYPAEQWAPGDLLLTRLTLPLPAGLPPGRYTLLAGLYSAAEQQSLVHLDISGSYAGERARVAEIELAGGPPTSRDEFMAANVISRPKQVVGLARDVELLGYALQRRVVRLGERFDLTLYWRGRSPRAMGELTLALGGKTVYSGQPVHGTFPFARWPAGQLLIDRYTLKVPADLPAGPAELTLTVGDSGSAVLTEIELRSVERNWTAPAAAQPLGSNFSGCIALHGYAIEAGTELRLTLYWQALTAMDVDYTVFVHVLDAAGQIVSQRDAPPQAGGYPTSLWLAGEFVSDEYSFALPPGTYSLEIGLYDAETGKRLAIKAPDSVNATAVVISPIVVP